jgi:hypothetical protein
MTDPVFTAGAGPFRAGPFLWRPALILGCTALILAALGAEAAGVRLALVGLALLLPAMAGLVLGEATRQGTAAPTLGSACAGAAVLALRGHPEPVVLAMALAGLVLGILPLAAAPLLQRGRRALQAVRGSEAWTPQVGGVLLLLYCLVGTLALLAIYWTPQVVVWVAMLLAVLYVGGLAVLAAWGKMVPPVSE